MADATISGKSGNGDEGLRAALDAASIGSWSFDLESGTLACSPLSKHLFGLPPESPTLPVEGWFALIHPEDRERARAAWTRALSERSPLALEFRVVLPGGEVRWLETRAALQREGGAARFVGVTMDRTERRLAQERQRESEERLRLAHQAAGIGAWEWNAATNAVFWSPEYREIYGLDPEAPPNFEAGAAAVHEDDREAVVAAVLRALETGGEFRTEHRVRHPSKGVRWVSAMGRAIADGSGRPVRMLGVVLDITERREAEAALIEGDRRKNEFLATLAHELRNPLAPIRTSVEILKRRPADATQRGAQEVIERQLAHMVRLIDDLLEVSRISNGKLELRAEESALSAVLDQALETSRPHLRERELEVSLPPEPVYVEADRLRLAQVFSNLLNNACKYTKPGGRIRISAERTRGEVRVSVTDDGIGIPAEVLPRLFEMFSQASPGRDRSQGGLGIGLALSRALVEMHGGRIEARSDGPGCGSEFVVTLPVLAPGAEPAAPVGPARASQSPKERRILVVDDNHDACRALAILLGLSGHQVRTAHDGYEALRVAKDWDAEVVVLDIGLPGMDGYETCRGLRALPVGKRLLILGLSGWGQEEDRRRSLEAGFDGHLVKPVDSEMLMRAISEIGL